MPFQVAYLDTKTFNITLIHLLMIHNDMTHEASIIETPICRKKKRPYAFQQQGNASSHTSLQLQTFRFQQQLRKFLTTPIDLKLNENISHFISIRFSDSMRPISASIHKIFLEAPADIIETLALYIQKKGQDASLTDRLRNYISAAPIAFQRTSKVLQEQARGKKYNLIYFLNDLNQRFFKTPVEASIIWFQSPKRNRPLRNCSLGLYFDELKLIKINSGLDSSLVPEYVVSLVVYHEMLHAIYPPKVYPSGKKIIHTPEFREAERRHPHFQEAEAWLDENRDLFFQSLRIR